MVTLESINQKMSSHESEYSNHKTWVIGELKEIRAEIDSRVSYQHFYWIIGILATILISISGYIVTIVNETRDRATVTQLDVSTIKGKLEPYQIFYEK